MHSGTEVRFRLPRRPMEAVRTMCISRRRAFDVGCRGCRGGSATTCWYYIPRVATDTVPDVDLRSVEALQCNDTETRI